MNLAAIVAALAQPTSAEAGLGVVLVPENESAEDALARVARSREGGHWLFLHDLSPSSSRVDVPKALPVLQRSLDTPSGPPLGTLNASPSKDDPLTPRGYIELCRMQQMAFAEI